MKEIAFALREHTGMQYLLDALTPNSPYGAELARRPMLHTPQERATLEAEWHNLAVTVAGMRAQPAVYDRLQHLFMQVRDLRGTLGRCADTILTEVELFEIKRFLLQIGLIAPQFALVSDGYQDIRFTEIPEALALLDPEGQHGAGFSISSAYSKALAAVRDEKRRLELRLREAPEGAARDGLLNERRLLVAREEQETRNVRTGLTLALRPHLEALAENARMIGRLDFLIAKAVLASRYNMVRPVLSDGGVYLAGMRHPQIADRLAAEGRAFTPVTIDAPQGVTVITGANMGGKSVALRTLVLAVLLAQAGFFVCADEADLPLFDDVQVVSEDMTDIARGLSSFGAEVLRLDAILRDVAAGTFCLVALDEPARGTNPQEGAALVKALVQWLAARRCVAVIATHYDGVARYARAHYQAAGLRDLPDTLPADDRLTFIAEHMNYGLSPVADDAKAPHEALTVCRLLGLNGAVTDAMSQFLQEEDV